ncbi:Putative L-lactate dehydrogenase operon regulatory protein [Thalassovita gelatinovora]|uniref:Putative L-lactate dehydrogenase operon regulatory protein n=1 Tax=Thalassovita gelatinovora TaxID=53501 RepID=A0A0P1FJD0_THAGE|nr:FCD domain-containing protein [Thalassovita gelatinovora]QIZ81622.1 FadR family transcriptional regulator [Thalassovita gelatinovora]CUH68085.1 Putative L-lactate dehydrogenase operon regulatory protein [Thalassovita gelatinovora]SEQ28931.1 transcriptional regulator, GntR family [Thalassovita gelatinovora]
MSDKVLTRVRNWIASSGLTEGGRLPPERELCARLGVSRAELRKANLVLESEGLLTRHVGRGTFLSKAPRPARGGGIDDAIATLAESTGPVDAMKARLVLEPEIARLAAMNATPMQLRELRRLAGAMRAASSWSAYEVLDGEFHETMAAASGNSLLQALHKIMNGVRLVVVWRRLKTSDLGPDPSYHSFAEHDVILTALENRDGAAASAAMQAHLNSTVSAMTAEG